jgi:hypothetical protein
MIMDKNLWFAKATDTAATATRAIPLGQSDLTGNTSGMGPYQNMYWVVTAGAAKSSGSTGITIKLQHSDTQGGTYTDLLTFVTPVLFAVGDLLVKTPVPFSAKNWLKVTLSAATAIESYLAYGVSKGVTDND